MATSSSFSRAASAHNRFRFLILASSALVASMAFAAPIPVERVQQIADGIASSVQVSYASGASVCMAQAVSPMEATVSAVASTNNPDETAFYVIDRGSTGGFVIMSADDRLDPVLVIAPTGRFDPTPGTPLYDLLCLDVQARSAAADIEGLSSSEGWNSLLDDDGSRPIPISFDGLASVSDVRVAPIVQSKWSQSTVGGKAVYNYYTPGDEEGDPDNCVCGCVATAGAQIMRFHEYPQGSVKALTRTCYLDGVAIEKTMLGGVYSWSDMPLVPTSSITDQQRRAIGKLCYDVGVGVHMMWTRGSSGAYANNLGEMFRDVFGYKNAIVLVNSSTLSATIIKNALLSNFDAGYPVELSIRSSRGGHSIVGDGYGYSGGTLYVHLNLGWAGSYDAWYNLPNIGTGYGFNVVDGAVYNIFPDAKGDLITGRVLREADGSPIAGATVQAFDGSTIKGTVTTSAAGIYALRLEGGKRYSVVASAPGAGSSSKSVYLTASVSTSATSDGRYWPGSGTVGNSWGNDIMLAQSPEPEEPPAPPTDVSASDGTSTAKVRVTWSASSGATFYKVYRATSASSSAASLLAASVTSSFYDDTSAEVGTTYWYWVKAGNDVGESDFSLSDDGWRAYAVPSAPTGVSASDGTSTAGVVVSWNAVSSATSYSVYRATSSSSSAASSIATGLTSTSYTDTSAEVGTTYWYWVRATNQGGTSEPSNSDSGYRKLAAPSAPTGVSASDGLSSTEIVVSWNAAATAASYEVWRGVGSSSSSASRIASGITVTSYSDTSAASGTTYYYWVKATNSGGTSGFSSSDTGYLAVIVGPTSLTASDGTYSSYVRVSWTESQSATSYEIWRGTVNAYSLASRLATQAATTYDDTSATPGALYYYWVRAVTSAGTSAFSSSDSGFRPLSVPTGVTATEGRDDGVVVAWSSVSGATSYEIGRRAEGAGGDPAVVGSATSLTYKDASAVPGVSYDYFVRAKASACTSAWSSSASGSRSIPTPTGLTASIDRTDCIFVQWPAMSGALSYELMRSPEDDIAYAETVATVSGSSSSYSDRTTEYGITYYYYLRANFSVGASVWSQSAAGSRAFPAPTGVSASDGLNTARITVTWDAIDGATLFQVWRYSDERGRNELVGTSTSTSYNDSKNIEPGVRYRYYVKAVFPTGTSALSNYDTGYLKSTSPTVVASDGTSTSLISLSWNTTPGAIAFHIYRSTTSSSADAQKIASMSMLDCSYDDRSVSRGTLYYYWVRTATAIDTSDFGTADTGYIALPGVSSVQATDGAHADKVVVSWGAVSGATSYEVWRGDSDDSSSASRVVRNVATTSWDDTSVTPGAKVWYWVRACDAGPGLWGANDSGYRKLSAPTDVTATTNQTDGVKVSWKGTTSGVSFEIRRAMTDNFSQAAVVATVSDKANYTDNTTVPGYVYYYWVMAYTDTSLNADSGWSSSARGYRAVAAPATVSATDGTSIDAVTVTWSAATSARRYEIWRNTTTKTDTAELIGTTNKLVWVDASAEPGVAYYYWIRSVSALDTSAFSNRDMGYVSTPAPADVVASDGLATNYVRVTWAGSEGALSYAVWRADSNDVSVATQVKADISGTTYDDTSAIPGKYHWYWVRPVSAAGPGVFAGPDRGFASLSAPTDVLATSNDVSRVTVSWRRASGATSYEIFRADTNEVAYATNEVFATATSTSYADTNAVPAVKYWYWVRACAEADISPLGGPGDGFRLLSVPTGIVATDGTSDEYVKISWNETWGADSYEVWRAENSTSTSAASLVAGVTNALEYLDTNATAGVSYTYWLKAVSELHTTAFSSSDKGWRSLPAPDTVTASDGTTSDGVIVEWSAVPGAIKYEVHRCEDGTAITNRVFTSADATVLAYTDTGAKAGTKYWYWVRTVATTGAGVFSLPDDGFRAVAPPTNVKATDGSSYDYVRVTWSAATGAESYEVCRTATNELYAATTNYYSVTGATFDDTNAVPGVIYGYSVRAVAPLSISSYAGPDDGYRKFRSATNLVASDGTSLDAVDLSWTSPTGAARCQIWRSTGTSSSAAVKLATVEGEAYSDTSALHGVKYYYWVNAVADLEGEMGTSNDGWRALVVPGNVQATDGDSTSFVRITWEASPDATLYEVRRGLSADPNSMSSIKTLSSPAELVWEDSAGTAGTNYYYSVRAGGTGGWSEFALADTGYKKLMPPTNVRATDGTELGQVRVTWSTVTGATHYRVYRAESDEAAKTALSGWITGTTYIDRAVKGGVENKYWYYVIAAVDATGARPSVFSAGDDGYSNGDGTTVEPIDLGNGISWPVTDNGDGTATTNAVVYSSIEGGRLTFSGISGAVGASTTVQTLVKTSIVDETVYTVPTELTIVSEGTAVLDLSTVWGTRPSLFVIGISTEPGEVLP